MKLRSSENPNRGGFRILNDSYFRFKQKDEKIDDLIKTREQDIQNSKEQEAENQSKNFSIRPHVSKVFFRTKKITRRVHNQTERNTSRQNTGRCIDSNKSKAKTRFEHGQR